MIPINQDPSDGGPWMPAWMQAWNPPPPITTGPGRYTSASNVWHIGMVCAKAESSTTPSLLSKANSRFGLDHERVHDTLQS